MTQLKGRQLVMALEGRDQTYMLPSLQERRTWSLVNTMQVSLSEDTLLLTRGSILGT